MHHNADFDSHEILSSLLSIGKNDDAMTRNSRARPARPYNNEFGHSKGIEILPGILMSDLYR